MELDSFFYDDMSMNEVFTQPYAPNQDYQFQGWQPLDELGATVIGTWIDPERAVNLSEQQREDIPDIAALTLDEQIEDVLAANEWLEFVTKDASRDSDSFRDTPYMSPEDIINSYRDSAAYAYLEIWYDEEDDSWYAIINY